jgi:hypothetical protein
MYGQLGSTAKQLMPLSPAPARYTGKADAKCRTTSVKLGVIKSVVPRIEAPPMSAQTVKDFGNVLYRAAIFIAALIGLWDLANLLIRPRVAYPPDNGARARCGYLVAGTGLPTGTIRTLKMQAPKVIGAPLSQ